MKSQSAMEYLMTYGWAILIISLAIVVIFELINVNSIPVQQCVMPAGFSCINFYLAQNGLLTINLLQTTQYPVNITAIGCNNPASTNNMKTVSSSPHPNVPLPINSNYTFTVQCYTNSTATSGNPGSVFSGWVALNYTQAYTQIPETIFGKVTARYT